MRIDESENSTLQVRTEYLSGLKGKHGHGDQDQNHTKKANNKKDRPEEQEQEEVPAPKKGSKAKKAKAKKAAKAAQAAESSSDEDSNAGDREDSPAPQKPAAPKEITAADRKKAKKQREKESKRDPADLMDPHNIKPVRSLQTDEDLKAQLAKFELRCSACPFGTDTHEEFKSHFKSEWHKVNLTRKVAEQPPLSEEQFKELLILKEFA